MPPRKTVLDAELTKIHRAAQSQASLIPRLARRAFALGARSDLARVDVSPDLRTDVKLIVNPGRRPEAEDWVVKHKGTIHSSDGVVMVAEIRAEALAKLEGESWVRRAEAPRRLNARMDEARGTAGARVDAYRQLHPTLDGSNVIVGVIDTGVDWTHPDFRDPAGSRQTRLDFFGFAEGPGSVGQPSKFRSFDRADLNAALNPQPGISASTLPVGDPHGHGTHCAGIAAGNGAASVDGRLRGVAPGATIMGVRSEPLFDSHTIWGIREIFKRAKAKDLPAVVSLSLGGHYGPHDGTSALETVIARESGPGRIIVVAAGNEGEDGIHWTGRLAEGSALTIPVRIADPSGQSVEVWVPRDDEVEILIETPDGAQYMPDGNNQDTVFGSFQADWQVDSGNLDQCLTLSVIEGNVGHTWRILLQAKKVIHGEVHAWGNTDDSANAGMLFPGAAASRYTVGTPACAERAIVVGSFVSRTKFQTSSGSSDMPGVKVGRLSPFSSQGPTRIGLQKPDISAPGQYITSALSAGSRFATHPTHKPRHHDASGKYITIQGTSMATPFVAGTIALMLQRERTLTPEDVRHRLRITATRDVSTGPVWNPEYGWGKLDATRLLSFIPPTQ